MAQHDSLFRWGMQIVRNEGPAEFFSRTWNCIRSRAKYALRQSPITRSVYYHFFDSIDYWETRYARGADSGPGSYGEHAQFKADVINEFIEAHDVRCVVEFGCGDGNQVALGDYDEYVGLDVAESAIERCRERFSDDETKRFDVYDPHTFDEQDALRGDLVLALEVVFHLVEDDVFEKTMRDIFETADRYVIIFSTNYDDPDPKTPHMKHREFTRHVDRWFPEFEQIDYVENEFDERISDFYMFERTRTGQTR